MILAVAFKRARYKQRKGPERGHYFGGRIGVVVKVEELMQIWLRILSSKIIYYVIG